MSAYQAFLGFQGDRDVLVSLLMYISTLMYPACSEFMNTTIFTNAFLCYHVLWYGTKRKVTNFEMAEHFCDLTILYTNLHISHTLAVKNKSVIYFVGKKFGR